MIFNSKQNVQFHMEEETLKVMHQFHSHYAKRKVFSAEQHITFPPGGKRQARSLILKMQIYSIVSLYLS